MDLIVSCMKEEFGLQQWPKLIVDGINNGTLGGVLGVGVRRLGGVGGDVLGVVLALRVVLLLGRRVPPDDPGGVGAGERLLARLLQLLQHRAHRLRARHQLRVPRRPLHRPLQVLQHPLVEHLPKNTQQQSAKRNNHKLNSIVAWRGRIRRQQSVWKSPKIGTAGDNNRKCCLFPTMKNAFGQQWNQVITEKCLGNNEKCTFRLLWWAKM